MKNIKFNLLPLLLGILLSGCVYSHRETLTPTGRVVVTESPPPPREEVITTAPSSSHVWVAGYWTNTGSRWVWVPGHWEMRPRPAAMWVPGHWDKNPDERGWVWTPGHWE